MFHLLTILMFFNLVAGTCCHKVEADYMDKNNAYGQRARYFTYYTMQAGTVNGKAHYLSGDKAIWYINNPKAWMVGKKENLGINDGQLYVHSTADCPYTPGYSWKYEDQFDNWRDADRGFSIWCKS